MAITPNQPINWLKRAFTLIAGGALMPLALSGAAHGWRLQWFAFSRGNEVLYHLLNEQIIPVTVSENEYKETANYFYSRVCNTPPVAKYLSKQEGGAVTFRGKERWSGNAEYFGKDFGEPMLGLILGGVSGLAIKEKDARKIIDEEFPGLQYDTRESVVSITWDIAGIESKAA